MSDEFANQSTEELIDIPSFLSVDDYGISLAEDCGNCQNGSESCGTTQAGICDACQGYGCEDCETCQPAWESSCTDACETTTQSCSQSCSESTTTKVTCTKRSQFYKNGAVVSTSTESESGLTPGLPYTPSMHMPSYDSSSYYLVSITYNGSDVTNTPITCPSSNFTCVYTFYAITSITPWSWTTSNGGASNSQTVAAYSAVLKGEAVENFSYLVWNDLVAKVYEMRDVAGQSPIWNTAFLSYSATLMSSTDKTLTADRFNSVRYNVGLVYSTGLNQVYAGQNVLGQYFLTLTEKMNEYIATL